MVYSYFSISHPLMCVNCRKVEMNPFIYPSCHTWLFFIKKYINMKSIFCSFHRFRMLLSKENKTAVFPFFLLCAFLSIFFFFYFDKIKLMRWFSNYERINDSEWTVHTCNHSGEDEKIPHREIGKRENKILPDTWRQRRITLSIQCEHTVHTVRETRAIYKVFTLPYIFVFQLPV